MNRLPDAEKLTIVGCSTVCLREYPVEQALRAISSAGFSRVELTAIPVFSPHVDVVERPPAQATYLRELLNQFELVPSGINSVAWYPDALDDPDELLSRHRTVADVAVALGIPVWVIDAGRRDLPPADTSRTPLSRLVDMLADVASLARDRGLKLALEVPHIRTLAEDVSESVSLLDALQLPDLLLDCDTSHVHRSGATADQYVSRLGNHVGHVSLRDVDVHGANATPGDGVFDYESLVAGLVTSGFDGPWFVELESPTGTKIDDVMAAAIRGGRFVEGLVTLAASHQSDNS